MTPRRQLILTLWVLLSGCRALVPEVHDTSDPGFEVPAAWTATTIAWDITSGWIEDLGEPRLPELVSEAIDANPELRAAHARLAQARAQAVVAGAVELPQLDAAGDLARRGTPQSTSGRATSSSFDAELAVAWEPDVWGRLANATRAALFDADASSFDLEAARLSLAANVSRGWFDASEADLQLRLAAETVENFEQNLGVVEEGFRSGLRSALDVRLERANLASARSQLESRAIARDRAVRTLEIRLGRYPAALIKLADSLPPMDEDVPPGIPADLVSRRPDVRAAAARLAAGDERLNAARKNRLPQFRLTASGGLASNELRSFLDFDTIVWSVATGLTAPIFQGGRLAAEVDVARARSRESFALYAQALLTAFSEVETALNAGSLLARQEAALREAAQESDEATALALERYSAGLVDIVTWLDARRRAFDAKSSLITVRNARLQNRISLHLALGGDFRSSESAGKPGNEDVTVVGVPDSQ